MLLHLAPMGACRCTFATATMQLSFPLVKWSLQVPVQASHLRLYEDLLNGEEEVWAGGRVVCFGRGGCN